MVIVIGIDIGIRRHLREINSNRLVITVGVINGTTTTVPCTTSSATGNTAKIKITITPKPFCITTARSCSTCFCLINGSVYFDIININVLVTATARCAIICECHLYLLTIIKTCIGVARLCGRERKSLHSGSIYDQLH